MKKIEALTVYHGRNNHDNLTADIIFFSSDERFSEDYGTVKPYTITIEKPFHTCQENHITSLIKRVGPLKDPYDGQEYTDYKEILESGLLYHDTWEIFEPHIKEIKQLDFDGMLIYEGGIENYICFRSEQFKAAENTDFVVA